MRDISSTGLSVFKSVIAGTVDVSFVDRASIGRVILGKSCIIGRVILGLVKNEEIEGRVICTVARLGLVMVGGVKNSTFVVSLDWPTVDVLVTIVLMEESFVVCIASLVISTVRVDRIFFVEPCFVGIMGNLLLVDAFEKSVAIVAALFGRTVACAPPIPSMSVVNELSTSLKTMSITSFVTFSNTSPASLQLLSSSNEFMVTCLSVVFVSISDESPELEFVFISNKALSNTGLIKIGIRVRVLVVNCSFGTNSGVVGFSNPKFRLIESIGANFLCVTMVCVVAELNIE